MQISVRPTESRVEVKLQTETEEATFVGDLLQSGRLQVDKPDIMPLPFRGQFLFKLPHRARPVALQVSRLEPTADEMLAADEGPRLLITTQHATRELLEELATAMRDVPPAIDDDAVGDGAGTQDEYVRIRRMTHPQRVIYATRAGQSGRAALLQQPNPLLLLYLCKNPLITLPEIIQIAKMPSIDALVAEYLTKLLRNNPRLAMSEELKLALCTNPKTPGGTALSLLRSLSSPSLRKMLKQGEVRTTVKQAAVRMLTERRE